MVAEISKKITGEVKVDLKITEEVKNVLDFKKEIEGALKKETTDVLESILGGGIGLGASDIHIEPEEEQTKLRIRSDGILQDVLLLSKDIYGSLLSRIKLLSGIKLNIIDRPQDG
ncbi:MAG: hypothetical protein HYT19_00930, partial [Candidatus Nealsonbacteria bacterium]|nr:hypothetical protein [Candidatus Nealsonbacteria bacterium]